MTKDVKCLSEGKKQVEKRMYRKELKPDSNWYLECLEYGIQKYDLGTADTIEASLRADKVIRIEKGVIDSQIRAEAWPVYLDVRTNKKVQINPYILENDPITKAEIKAELLKIVEG